jgi:hypothetical protein
MHQVPIELWQICPYRELLHQMVSLPKQTVDSKKSKELSATCKTCLQTKVVKTLPCLLALMEGQTSSRGLNLQHQTPIKTGKMVITWQNK